MATRDVRTSHSGVIDRLFTEHPRSLGMSWAEHGVGAGVACLVHAVVPGWFTQTAGKTVTRIYDHIQSRKAGAADPENWPDYEI